MPLWMVHKTPQILQVGRSAGVGGATWHVQGGIPLRFPPWVLHSQSHSKARETRALGYVLSRLLCACLARPPPPLPPGVHRHRARGQDAKGARVHVEAALVGAERDSPCRSQRLCIVCSGRQTQALRLTGAPCPLARGTARRAVRFRWLCASRTSSQSERGLSHSTFPCRWLRPEGRAFEVVMCELKRRLLGAAKITLDTNACTLDCGERRRGRGESESPCHHAGPQGRVALAWTWEGRKRDRVTTRTERGLHSSDHEAWE